GERRIRRLPLRTFSRPGDRKCKGDRRVGMSDQEFKHVFRSVRGTARFPRNSIFFTPYVDTPAATALDVMLAKGVSALTEAQRMDGTRLLVSFGVRAPETLREMGPKEVTKAFDIVEAAAKGPRKDERKVNAIIQANVGIFKRNFPLHAAMELSTDPQKLGAVG